MNTDTIKAVLAVYPDATAEWNDYLKCWAVAAEIDAHIQFVAFGNTRDEAWDNAFHTVRIEQKP